MLILSDLKSLNLISEGGDLVFVVTLFFARLYVFEESFSCTDAT